MSTHESNSPRDNVSDHRMRPAPDEPPVVSSEQLFGHGNEVRIQHGETTYRLILTRLGKLVLNK